MTQSYWQRSLREPEIEVDVAIVGGGITGCSVAYWLRREEPQLDVAILEAGRIAEGASGRNAGFLLQGISSDYALDVRRYGRERARWLWTLTLENRQLIASELGQDAIDLETSGSIIAAGTEEENERLQEAEVLLHEDGFDAAYLAKSQVCERLHATGFLGGLFVPSGAACHPVKLVRHVAAESGAAIYEHHRVMDIRAVGRGLVLETTARPVRARQVVFCLNAYLAQLLPELEEVVRPVRAQMFATEPLARRFLSEPVYSHEGYYYIRQLLGGEVLLGGARHLHRADEAGYADTTTEALQADLHAYLQHHFPDLPDVPVQQRWSGVMGFTEDRLPRVQKLDSLPGAWAVGGYTGHGMALAFLVGRLAAGQILQAPSQAEDTLFTGTGSGRACP